MTTQRQPRRRDEPPPSAEALLSRAPPSDLEAEKGVLGSILLKPDVTDDVALVVRAEDFHSPAHRKLYETMLAIHNGGKQVDVTLVASRLKKLGEFDVIGGAAFLLEIVECVPTAHNAVHYARVVAERRNCEPSSPPLRRRCTKRMTAARSTWGPSSPGPSLASSPVPSVALRTTRMRSAACWSTPWPPWMNAPKDDRGDCSPATTASTI
jgi:hypothetical protein